MPSTTVSSTPVPSFFSMSTKPLAFSLNSENLSSVLIELRSPFMFPKMFLMIVNNPENMF